MTPEDDTWWIVTTHDAVNRVVTFARFTHGSRVCVRAGDQGRSLVDIAYTYTAISPAGDAFIDRFTAEAFRDAMMFWGKSMNHWIEQERGCPEAINGSDATTRGPGLVGAGAR